MWPLKKKEYIYTYKTIPIEDLCLGDRLYNGGYVDSITPWWSFFIVETNLTCDTPHHVPNGSKIKIITGVEKRR